MTDAAAQFDQLGAVYDLLARSPIRRHLEIPTVFHHLGDVTGAAVLDLGSGSGVYTRKLMERGAARAVGLDATDGMVEYARGVEDRNPVGAEYLTGPLPGELDGTFDAVLAVYVLPYAENRAQLDDLCRTAARALRPGGRFVTLPCNPDLSRDRAYYERYGLRTYGEPTGRDPDPVNLDICYFGTEETVSALAWSTEAVNAALSRAGFTGITWSGPIVTPEGFEELGTEFWQPYLDCPHALTVTAVHGGLA